MPDCDLDRFNLLRCVDESRWLPLLQLQAAILTELSGQPVISMAMHQPGLNGADPLEGRADVPFLNAYAPRFFREMPYVSDSCRAWRDSAWGILTGDPLPPRFQLVLHPLNWGPHDRERTEIGDGVRIGASTTICPGTVILPELTLPPSITLLGTVDHRRRKTLLQMFARTWSARG